MGISRYLTVSFCRTRLIVMPDVTATLIGETMASEWFSTEPCPGRDARLLAAASGDDSVRKSPIGPRERGCGEES